MRADHGDAHRGLDIGRWRWQAVIGGQRLRGGAQGQTGGGVVPGAELDQRPVRAGGRDQRDAEGQAIGADRRGHGQRGVVEQVDEVGVMAEAAIELDGIGLHGLDADLRGRCRHDQQVDVVPHRPDLLRQRLQLRLRVEDIGRAEAPGGPDDASDRLDDLGLVCIEERAYRSMTLSHQRAAVQQLGGARQRCIRNPCDRRAQIAQALQRFIERRFRQAIAEELQFIGNADARPRREGRGPPRQRARVWVARVAGRGRLQHAPGNRDRAREDRHHVDASRRGYDAGGADQAAAGLQSDDVVESGGDAAGPGGVGAEREVDLAGRHDIGRAGT